MLGARNAGGGNGTHRICLYCGHYKNLKELGGSYEYNHTKHGCPFEKANQVYTGWCPCEVCKKAAHQIGYQGPPNPKKVKQSARDSSLKKMANK